MQEWWLSLDLFMKTLWGIAIFTSLVFIVQSIMTFVGMDSNADADFDGDMTIDSDGGGIPFQLFTFRNFINFFLGFSWAGITFRPMIANNLLLIIASAVVGVILVALVMYMFLWLTRMQQSGNIDINKSAVGCRGNVYLPIPAGRAGEGKVQIGIQGAVREFDAMTDGGELSSGVPIKVVAVLNSRTLLVERVLPNKTEII